MKLRRIYAAVLLIAMVLTAGCVPAEIDGGHTGDEDVSHNPTAEPTAEPTSKPTSEPTAEPTEEPTEDPWAGKENVLDMRGENMLVTDEEMPMYDRMISILAKAAKALENVDTVVINSGYNAWRLSELQHLDCENGPIQWDDPSVIRHQVIHITSDEDRQTVQYLLLLHTITVEYPDCVCWKDAHLSGEILDGMYWSTLLLVTDGYKAMGFDTTHDYYLAMQNGECSQIPWDECFYLDYAEASITMYTDRPVVVIEVLPQMLEEAKQLNEG